MSMSAAADIRPVPGIVIVFKCFLFLTLPLLLTATNAAAMHPHEWSNTERETLAGLQLVSLPPLPANPSNAHAEDPRAQALGKLLFFDTTLSGNMRVSCATCHRPDYSFTDDLPLAHGMGTTRRRTMPLIGMAYQVWFFWDGRKDSMWSQALGPIESPLEHGFTRTRCFRIIRERYREPYEEVFGPLPSVSDSRCPTEARPATDDPAALKSWVLMTPGDREAINRVYANMGKAIEAYVRTLMPEPARFDEYVSAILSGNEVEATKLFSPLEATGLRLFIGKAKCINCHNGPLFTNGDFHHVVVPDGEMRDPGRKTGITAVLSDEFNCAGPYSDAGPNDCAELRFIDAGSEKFDRAFKTPTLRNVSAHPPYMHAGQFATLSEVLETYRKASLRPVDSPDYRTDIQHAELTDDELRAIEAFLHTLNSAIIERNAGTQ